jgi:hypothetical protein
MLIQLLLGMKFTYVIVSNIEPVIENITILAILKISAVLNKMHDISQEGGLLFVELDRRHFAHSIEPAD